MKVHGACHCGRITYEADVDPARVSICHCTDCQVMSGSPYRASVPSSPGTYRLLSGTPRTYVKTTAASGNRRRQAFCGDCGTPIAAGPDVDDAPFVMLRLGALAERAALTPTRRIWCGSEQPWSVDIGALPGSPAQ